jgi:hypothetical protein
MYAIVGVGQLGAIGVINDVPWHDETIRSPLLRRRKPDYANCVILTWGSKAQFAMNLMLKNGNS